MLLHACLQQNPEFLPEIRSARGQAIRGRIRLRRTGPPPPNRIENSNRRRGRQTNGHPRKP